MRLRTAATWSTDSISCENSREGRFRQLETTSPFATSFHTIAVPKVIITLPLSFHHAEAFCRVAFAPTRNSSAVGRAKEVWCHQEHIFPAPAPISTHSSMRNGTQWSRRAMEFATDTGL